MNRLVRKLHVRWLVLRGKAVDIWSKSKYPANTLSNLSDNEFYYDGIYCRSMEGFLQSLKQQDESIQRQIRALKGKEAKSKSTSDWQRYQTVWWKGRAIARQSDDFAQLVTNAYRALFEQNAYFRTALQATKGKKLLHSRGQKDPRKTILTEQEFCKILTELRDNDRNITANGSI